MYHKHVLLGFDSRESLERLGNFLVSNNKIEEEFTGLMRKLFFT